MPQLFDAKFPCFLEFRLRDQALGKVEHVRGPNATADDPFIDPCSRNDQDIPAYIASDETRDDSAFSKPSTTDPVAESLEHGSDAVHIAEIGGRLTAGYFVAMPACEYDETVSHAIF